MMKGEATQVLTIMLSADGGCQYCARALMVKFVTEFPEYKELAKRIYLKEYPNYENLWEDKED